MLKLRPYKSCDAEIIAKWVQDKNVDIAIAAKQTIISLGGVDYNSLLEIYSHSLVSVF